MEIKESVMKQIDLNRVSKQVLFGTSWKLRKTERKDGTINMVLYLSPANECTKESVCSHSTKFCRSSCLIHSGLMVTNPAYLARIHRTAILVLYPELFYARVDEEINKGIRKARKENKELVVRMNGTSDLDFSSVYEKFPNVQFVEYTKNKSFMYMNRRFSNVHFTYSRSDDKFSEMNCMDLLSNGFNVAVVFNSDTLPETYLGYRVIDGDLSDNRHKDPNGVVVGLRLKGTIAVKKIAIESKFAVGV